MKKNKVRYIWQGMIPVCLVICLIIKYGVNVLFWDEWEMVNYFSDGLTLDFLLSPHNEHRLFFPKLLMIFLNWLFDWNSKVQMLFSVFLLVAAYYALWSYVIKKENVPMWEKSFKCIIIGFSLFSPIQYFNFLMGFQIAFNLVTTMTVISFYCLHRYYTVKSMRYYTSAMLCAVVASFSSLQGLILWIAMLIVSSIIYALERKNLKWLLIQYGVAVLTFFLYFYNWSTVEEHPKIGEGGIFNIIKGFLIIAGGICGNNNEVLNLVVGLLFLCLIGYFYLKAVIEKNVKEKIFGIGISLFGLGAAGAVTLGRIGFGVDNLLASVDRYAPFSILIFIGLFILIVEEKKSLWRYLIYVLGGLFVINSFTYLSEWKETKQQRSSVQYIVQNYRGCCLEELKTVYPWNNYQDAYNAIYELEKRKINAFFDVKEVKQSSIEMDAAAEVSFLNGYFLGFDASTVMFDEKFLYLNYPWVVDFIYGETYEKVYIKINDALYEPHQNWVSRQDVADAFDNSNYEYSGFTFSLPIQKLEYGKNTISLIVFLRGGIEYYESQKIDFFIDENGISLEN